MNQAEFENHLNAQDCSLHKITEWGYHIYRHNKTGKIAGINYIAGGSDAALCSVCHDLKISPPDHLAEPHKTFQKIKSATDTINPNLNPN